ncbi:PAS domain-containing hybrid sensor histidine kinase/response regulator [Methylotetracoccus oryzae]|uniref:PAS domain-containing hybrid sensor histidine kinase/response regulator n=1 Tax=Methylotetracoccus oryzae TaxID=1919059 RepID=UPI00111B569E|nr:PAS domain-containing protein [Methylotetracoccus oryzae]
MKVPQPAFEEPAVGTVDENCIRTPPATEQVAANELNSAASRNTDSIAYLKSELERQRRLLSRQDEELRGLRESEKRLRDTLDHAPVLVFIKDIQGRYLFANRRCAELLHADPENIVGKTTDELFAPEVAAKLTANDRWVLSGQGCRQVEELLPVNGAWRTFLSSQFPLTDLDGNIYATCGISTDITERKRAEALNHKLAAIIEASSDLIATATPDGRIEYMNRAGRALLGIGATESLLHTTIEDYHPVWAYRRVVEAGVPAAFEFGRWQGDNAMLTRSGAEIPVSQMILAQKDAETGDLEFIATVCRDITERQRTEMALRKLQQEQELILDSVPAMIFYKDTANRLLRVNARVAEALGLPKDRIEGRHTSEFFPDEAERYYQDDLIVIRSGQPRLGIEEPIRVAADRVRWLSTDKVPLKDAAGKVTGVLVMATDITDRKLIAEALQERERRLSESQRIAHIGSWSWDFSETLSWSEETFRIYGVCPENFTPTVNSLLECLHPDDRSLMQAWITACAAGDAPPEFEFRALLPGGRVRHLTGRGELQRDERHLPMRIAGTVQDITDRKLAEAALQDADRRKDEFLATLAHELRNPLAPIGNAVQILQTAGIDDPTRTWCCELIRRQMEHLTKLVDELLDISRITRGKISLDWQPVAVGDIVERALESCRPLLETYRHQLDLLLPSAAAYVEGDPVRLAQVVSNLLNNAAKYTEPGGHIALRVEPGDDGIILRVKDNGIGIPPALLSQVFQMFTQGDQSLEKTHGGLGIGLSLARELVALHHGSIQAYSAGAGQGSEFVVWLPAASPPSEPAPAQSEAAPAPSPPRRVLVADDNQDAGDSLAALLRALGHEVYIARDGLEAVAAAEAHRPEFILMDIGMPRLNGYDACRRIREHAWGRDIVITALTGWGQDSDLQRSQAAGFSHHLTKPVDFNALRQLIDTLPSTA